jgi:hypothetical protein
MRLDSSIATIAEQYWGIFCRLCAQDSKDYPTCTPINGAQDDASDSHDQVDTLAYFSDVLRQIRLFSVKFLHAPLARDYRKSDRRMRRSSITWLITSEAGRSPPDHCNVVGTILFGLQK